MRILILGSGIAEHALIWKILKSKKHLVQLLVIPGNIGFEDEVETLDLDLNDIDRLLEVAIARQIDLTIVGESRLFSLGICDKFREAKKLIVGPSKLAAEIESSQSFIKKLILDEKIPSNHFAVFDNLDIAEVYLHSLNFPVLIRAENPFLFQDPILKVRNLEEAYAAIDRFYRPSIGANKIIIEDCPKGDLFSINLLSDSHRYVKFPLVHSYRYDVLRQDHNLSVDWGAYAPSPLLSEALINKIDHEIIKPTLDALTEMGRAYQGFMSFDVFFEAASSIKLFQIRTSLAASDAQVIYPLLDEELVDLLGSVARFNLSFYEEGLKTYLGSALNVNLLSDLRNSSDFMPALSSKNEDGSALLSRKEDFLEGIPLVFFNRLSDSNKHRLEPILGATALAENLLDAQILAYKILDKIKLPNKQFKTDIGDEAML
jgi:phosphoribosylamine---glycine ligase